MSEVDAALARLAARDPRDAEVLRDALDRLRRAGEALVWARERLPLLVAAEGEARLLHVVVDEAAAASGAAEVWAVTWSGTAARPSFRALAGKGGPPSRVDGVPLAPDTLSRTVLAQVVRDGRPTWTDDASADPRFAGVESVQLRQLGAVGCVPLGPRGALYLTGGQRRFDREVRARLTAWCALAAALLPDPERPQRRAVEPLPGLVGASAAMAELAAAVRAFAPLPWPVLILGETGTGKEAVARALHSLSSRADRPFVALSCATLTDELAESALFGHERGAFTGADRRRDGAVAQAQGGTLFLDEVGELSPRVQPKLLRLLQEGTWVRLGDDREQRFAGRVVAATHRPVDGGGGFREDLYHRLAAAVVRVPSLRDRPTDVPLLAEALLARTLREIHPANPAGLTFDAGATGALSARGWPGNVRELQNAIRGAVARALAEGAPRIGAHHLPIVTTPAPAHAAVTDLAGATDAFQRAAVEAALAACGGNRSEAAARLGVSRQWLHKLLARWDGAT